MRVACLRIKMISMSLENKPHRKFEKKGVKLNLLCPNTNNIEILHIFTSFDRSL